jgi:hypothetical protein
LEINWTIIISTCITSAFGSATTFLTIRYLGKVVDKIEKKKDSNEDIK